MRFPASITAFRNYSARELIADVIAGITVGLVALPLAMAFAISSGLPPQTGIYTAVVAGFLISALGGSNVQIGGPTGAFVVVVSGITVKYGIDGLYVCTMLAGLMLVILGATGMGSAVRFIPRPIIVGFTNGIALLIASTQIKDFFGLHLDKVPSEFLARSSALLATAPTWSPATTGLAALTFAILVIARIRSKRVPGSIVALLLGTVLSIVFRLPVETIGSHFHGIPSGLPHFMLPHLELKHVESLVTPALTVAMLCAIESLLSAVVADRMTGSTHDPNVELVAQGIANIASPLFGGIPATGAIARTATNIRSGGKTPVAGIIHAVTLAVILLVAAPLASYIPLCVLSAILLMVAYNMGEWREIPQLLKLSASDITVWAVTFFLTVFADLTIAVEVGMVLAALLFIQRISSTTTVSRVTHKYIHEGREHTLQDKHIPDYVTVYRIHGPFLFGTTDKINGIYAEFDSLAPVVILRLRNMTALDATGMLAIEELAEKLRAANRTLILCGAREQPARLIRQARFELHVGAANICASVTDALSRAEQIREDHFDLTAPSGASD